MERLTLKKCGEILVKDADGDYRSPCFGCENINFCKPEKQRVCGIYKAIEKLAEYEDLEEYGKLLKLPCKVGDMVYEINRARNIVSEFVVKGFSISEYGIIHAVIDNYHEGAFPVIAICQTHEAAEEYIADRIKEDKRKGNNYDYDIAEIAIEQEEENG